MVDDKALKGVLEIMIQPVLLLADGKGVTLTAIFCTGDEADEQGGQRSDPDS